MGQIESLSGFLLNRCHIYLPRTLGLFATRTKSSYTLAVFQTLQKRCYQNLRRLLTCHFPAGALHPADVPHQNLPPSENDPSTNIQTNNLALTYCLVLLVIFLGI